MTELLTAARMRAIEQAAIKGGAITGLELMERAGRGVVEAIFEEWPELAQTSYRAVVLCGPGNNGGDGFVVARLLREWGWKVEVFLYGDPERLPPDAGVNHGRWREMGEEVRDSADITAFGQLPDLGATLFIDALFGTGLTRLIDRSSAALGFFFEYSDRWLSEQGPPTVSIDLPSGLCADSGAVLGKAMVAALTVTFHAPKRGHFLQHPATASGAANCCGRICVADIGLPPAKAVTKAVGLTAHAKAAVRNRLSESDRLSVFMVDSPGPEICKGGGAVHKYSHGHALILSGPSGRTGAARLAALGALRIGAGLVTLGSPPSALMENAAHLTAIMLRRVGEAKALAELLEDARINALCLGPGMGSGAHEASLMAAALGLRSDRTAPDAAAPGMKRGLVFDADALTILSRSPELFAGLHGNCVLTPHAGEFARLFPDIAGLLNAPATKGPAYSRVDATRAAAARAGCVVLFKGPDTVIAAPDGRCSINSAHHDRAAPWLATAGSGDVLAGFVTGLLARGFGPMRAAETAAWLHVECALSFGPGLIAGDLPDELPKVLGNLGNLGNPGIRG